MPSRLLALLCLIAALALVVAGCGSDEDEDSNSGPTAAADCNPGELETVEQGTLTVATDSPAFPPYFVNDDPTNGKGFESAVAYAIAEELGFAENEVEWTVVPFNSSYEIGRAHV